MPPEVVGGSGGTALARYAAVLADDAPSARIAAAGVRIAAMPPTLTRPLLASVAVGAGAGAGAVAVAAASRLAAEAVEVRRDDVARVVAGASGANPTGSLASLVPATPPPPPPVGSSDVAAPIPLVRRERVAMAGAAAVGVPVAAAARARVPAAAAPVAPPPLAATAEGGEAAPPLLPATERVGDARAAGPAPPTVTVPAAAAVRVRGGGAAPVGRLPPAAAPPPPPLPPSDMRPWMAARFSFSSSMRDLAGDGAAAMPATHWRKHRAPPQLSSSGSGAICGGRVAQQRTLAEGGQVQRRFWA